MSDWRHELSGFFEQEDKAREHEHRSELETFVADTVLPALEQVAEEMRRHGREAVVRNSDTTATLIVRHAGEEEMRYRVQGRTFPNGILPYAEIRFRQRKGLKFITVESMFRSGIQDYTLADMTREEIIADFVQNYTKRVQRD